MAEKQMNLNFEFIKPTEKLMSLARGLVSSPSEDCRAVSKAVLDVTAEADKVRGKLARDENADLAPYFDFWFADAVECANRLIKDENDDVRYLATCLIEIEKAVIKSKESFLAEMKRVGVKFPQ
jgi:hypothetical protein